MDNITFDLEGQKNETTQSDTFDMIVAPKGPNNTFFFKRVDGVVVPVDLRGAQVCFNSRNPEGAHVYEYLGQSDGSAYARYMREHTEEIAKIMEEQDVVNDESERYLSKNLPLPHRLDAEYTRLKKAYNEIKNAATMAELDFAVQNKTKPQAVDRFIAGSNSEVAQQLGPTVLGMIDSLPTNLPFHK